MSKRWSITVLDHPGVRPQEVCICVAGERFECMWGFVGADAEGGRICVPDEESECPDDCGSDGQPACDDSAPPRPPTLIWLFYMTGGN